jgi:hypothetical protein
MPRRGFLAPVWALLAAAAAFGQGRTPVLVELFTSEACSSCPPADNVLARLESLGLSAASVNGRAPFAKGARGPATIPPDIEIIALGEHVDYWDQTGWKDRFSSPLFSARQQDYGLAFKVASIYTPQIVINGAYQALGSDMRAVENAIRKAALDARADVRLANAGSQTVSIKIGKLPPGSHQAEMLLAITETGVETGVFAGENSGRFLRHAAVVRTLTSLGKLDPKRPGEYSAEARIAFLAEWNRQNLKVVLFVQDTTTRRILGAAALKI